MFTNRSYLKIWFIPILVLLIACSDNEGETDAMDKMDPDTTDFTCITLAKELELPSTASMFGLGQIIDDNEAVYIYIPILK